jgi:very-short-patch-repair endonuclease
MNPAIDQDVVKLYKSGNYSTYELAEKFETYPNKIRRILRKNGVPLRSKSAAQKNALKKGRASHPTKGKSQSDATKRKISDSQGKIWDNMTPEERQKRSDNGKDAWNKKSEEEQSQLIRKAQDAIRESSKRGSKLERFLLDRLTEAGLRVEFHKDHWLKNQNLQVDLFIPELRTAIEVDGPSHFKPVWGMENLIKNQRSDQQKTGLILGSGLVMVRIRQDKKLSQRYQRKIIKRLFEVLDRVKEKYPEENERYFEI